MKCWASALGNCDSQISREHLVSEAFWPDAKITVVGLPWCKTVPKEVGPAAIVSKILCRTHNSLLSPVDQGGADAFHALEAAELLLNRRRRLAAQPFMRVGFTSDGTLLERWFIKTTINLLIVAKVEITWALGGTGAFTPPVSMIRAAFGLENLVRPVGLYLAASVGDNIRTMDGLAFMPLFDANEDFAAALYDFRGFRFVLNLIQSPLPETLPEMPGAAAAWGGARPNYHLHRINSNVGSERSHFVDFLWPDSRFDHFAA